MNHGMVARLLVILTVAQPALAGRDIRDAQAGSTVVPRFERAGCPVAVAPDERIDCGVLFVPENRHKTLSRAIRLTIRKH